MSLPYKESAIIIIHVCRLRKQQKARIRSRVVLMKDSVMAGVWPRKHMYWDAWLCVLGS